MIEKRDPIPLAAPDGTIYAYACGWCRKVQAAGSFMIDHDDELVAKIAQSSRSNAERCCVCGKCGARSEHTLGSQEPPLDWCLACWNDFGRERARIANEETTAAMAEENAAYEASLALAVDRNAALALERAMRDWSEDNYCAGWMSGLEYQLWETEAPVAWILRALSGSAGGWWVHRRFVPMAEWIKMYEERPK